MSLGQMRFLTVNNQRNLRLPVQAGRQRDVGMFSPAPLLWGVKRARDSESPQQLLVKEERRILARTGGLVEVTVMLHFL